MGEESKKILIIYSGDDEAYFTTLKHRYINTYENEEFEFMTLFSKDPSEYQKIFIQILQNRPNIVYVDFSFNQDTQMSMATLLKRLNTFKEVPVVGLVQSKDEIKQCASSGVDVTHIKCGEYHDVIYDPMVIGFPKKAKDPGFARAKFEYDAHLIDDFRIGYIAPEYIHAEGNLKLTEGDIIEIETEIPVNVVPSKKFIVKKVYDTNLYYDFHYCFDLEFVFVDRPVFDDADMEEAMKIQDAKQREKEITKIKQNQRNSMNEYESNFKRAKKKLKEWIYHNKSDSTPKKTKILLIDKWMKSLESEEKPLDQYPYTIRCQTIISQSMRELDAIRPSIIATRYVSMDNIYGELGIDPEETDLDNSEIKEQIQDKFRETESVAMNQISAIIEKVRNTQNYQPFLIIFDCGKYNSKALQDTYKYPFIITNPNPMEMKSILELADMYEKKQQSSHEAKVAAQIEKLKKQDPVRYGRLTPADFEEDRYFISKKSKLSYVAYWRPITLKTMTESECSFLFDQEIDLGRYRLNFPSDISIKLIPTKDGKMFEADGGKLLYQAIIHSSDEDDKKAIRKFVNDIFFSGINEEREAEQAAFKELNEKVLMEKIQAEVEAEDLSNEGGEEE